MIGIVDYGMGNLRSVQKGLQRIGSDARIIGSPGEVEAADKLIVPGVGAFADAMVNLRRRGLIEPVLRFIESGRPFLGVCLGMQLLFEVSEEDGEHEGLGVLPGRVVRFQPDDRTLKVPHMGWNRLDWSEAQPPPLFDTLSAGCTVYFVHSYYPAPSDPSVVATTTDYGGGFCSSVHRGNVWAVQFHPEKSQHVGLTMLANFAAMEEERFGS